ncbi:MAG: GtrA family protein [Patescibacteria group bacterium]|nr:GtrA family protein [Patescibacteria group bacterium]
MEKLFRRRGVRQFIKFGIVGASSTVIDWGIFYFLNLTFGIYYLTAKVLSFSIAVFNSFIWNRRWTFRSTDPSHGKEFTKFLIIALVGLSLNALIMYLAVSIFHTRKIFGLAFATGIVTFWNFLANKFYTFKHSQA